MTSNKTEDNFTILLVADNFDPHFVPVSAENTEEHWLLASVNNAMRWISLINVPEVPHILVVSSTLSNDDLEQVKSKWGYYFKSFRSARLEDCMSVGQIMREVESRNLLPKGEFLLIENLAAFCSSNLKTQIEAFRTRRKTDKNCVMSMLYSEQVFGDLRVVCIETASKKLLIYQGKEDSAIFDIDKKMFITQATIRGDLTFCGIVICSTEIMIQFADNPDFETLDEVVHEVLVNEDLHSQTINIEILPHDPSIITIKKKKSRNSSLRHSKSTDQPAPVIAATGNDIILDRDFYYSVFVKEISESMKETFENEESRASKDAINNLSIEINCTKLANNISSEDLTLGIFSAFISLPIFETKTQFGLIKKTFIEWMPLWNRYYRTRENKKQLLQAIEDAAQEGNATMRALSPPLVKLMYDEMDDMADVILSWYEALPQDSVLREDFKALYDWLQDDEDEDDDEGDEENDGEQSDEEDA